MIADRGEWSELSMVTTTATHTIGRNISHQIAKNSTMCIGRANNRLITIIYIREVKGWNTMTIRDHKTQPFIMMAIQITHKQAFGKHILSLHGSPSSAYMEAIYVSRLGMVVWSSTRLSGRPPGRLGKTIGFCKNKTHWRSVSQHKPQKIAFPTATLEFGFVKCSTSISHIWSNPSRPRDLSRAQQDWETKSRKQKLRHVTHIWEHNLGAQRYIRLRRRYGQVTTAYGYVWTLLWSILQPAEIRASWASGPHERLDN